LIDHKVLVPVGDGTVGNGFNNQVWEADVFRYRDIASKLKARDEYLTGCGFPDVRRLSEDDVSGFSFSKLELLLRYMGKILDIANDNQEIIRSALIKRREDDRLAAGEFFQDLAKAKKIPTAVLSYLQRNPEAIKDIVGNLPDPEAS
jgi:hypothetical protein